MWRVLPIFERIVHVESHFPEFPAKLLDRPIKTADYFIDFNLINCYYNLLYKIKIFILLLA